MRFLSVKETAERWQVSERYVQQRCTQGRVEGACKFGAAWMIPEDAPRPADRRRHDAPAANAAPAPPEEHAPRRERIPLPLMNTAFPLGGMRAAAEAVEDTDDRQIALAEYHFYTGRAGEAVQLAEPYVEHPDLDLSLAACFIYGFASLAVDRIGNTRRAMAVADRILRSMDEEVPLRHRALAVFVCSSQYTLLHLKRPANLPELQLYMQALPAGLKLFAAYVQARFAYLNRLYGVSIGMVETAIALEGSGSPVPLVCLRLQCTMAYMMTPYPQLAKKSLMEAWEMAKQDDIIEPFGELHGELWGMLEAVIKKESPEDFRKMIRTAKEFSAGWREIHNALTGNRIPSDLTPTEFTVAMLVARGWLSKEISAHLDISESAVKKCVTIVMQKMHLSKRSDLAGILLPG